jgi:hypothetical protein
MQSFSRVLALANVALHIGATTIEVDGHVAQHRIMRSARDRHANQVALEATHSIEIVGKAGMQDALDDSKGLIEQVSKRAAGNASRRWDWSAVHYDIKQVGTACRYHYLKHANDNCPEGDKNPCIQQCAEACDEEWSCDLFSFGTEGCLISACNNSNGLMKSEPCGYAEKEHVFTMGGQCGTQEMEYQTLYSVSNYDVIKYHTACDGHYITPSGDHHSAVDCSNACAESLGCHAFSFGSKGCRFSACNATGALATDGECASYEYSGRNYADQCGATAEPDNYLYIVLQYPVSPR